MTLHSLPSWAPMAGLTLGSRIWLKAGAEWLLDHEKVHLAQQAQDGLLRWLWRYLTSGAWRVRYELPAYALDVRRGHRSIEEAARSVSGPLYLWPCSYEAAFGALATQD